MLPNNPRRQSFDSKSHCVTLAAGAAWLVTSAAGADRSWSNPAGGDWSVPGNWQAVGVPGNTDHVRLGNLPNVHNELVRMDIPGEMIGALTITDGMRLSTGSRSLRVSGDTLISGLNTVPGPDGEVDYPSRMTLGSVDGLSFRTTDLTVMDRASVILNNYALAGVDGLLTLDDGFVIGEGVISFTGAGTTVRNNGMISGRSGSGLRLQQIGGGLYDLDGTTGQGEINAYVYDPVTHTGSTLRIFGTGLTDPFSGLLVMAPHSEVEIDLSAGWVADANSEFRFFGMAGAHDPTVLHGGPLDFHGELNVGGGVNHTLRVHPSEFALHPDARVTLVQNTTLELGDAGGAEVVVHGGLFTVADGAKILFNGPTEWRGTPSFTGLVRQVGPATVGAASTIEAEQFDMDGISGNTVWEVDHNLVINADRIDSLESANTFHGTLGLGGGFVGKLVVNLTDPGEAWGMAGLMELTGSALANFPLNRLEGSHVLMTGRTEITHRVRVTAGMTIAAGSEVEFASPAAAVQMTGETIIEAGASLLGLGTLENAQGGFLTLRDGVLFGGVGLVNSGLAGMGEEPGVVSVPWFENTSTGEWTVTVGGVVPGSTHDLLIVSDGTAALAGKLSVRLADLGGGFTPQIGDEFTVLTALDGVDGSFAVVSKSTLNGLDYHWDVDYEPNAVVLRLASVGPAVCDADLNADGLLNFFDVAVYTAMYNDQNAGADFAAPWGTLNFFDVAAYMNAYQNGCP